MRKSLVCLTLALLCLLAACTSNYQPGDVENSNPPPYFKDGYPEPEEVEKRYETDYSQITATAEQESYPVNAEELIVNIRNPSNKKFIFYQSCYLEQKSGWSWKRLNHQPDSLHFGFGWMRAMDGYTILTVRPENVRQTLKPGEYRFVVFVGNEVLYAPFTLTKE